MCVCNCEVCKERQAKCERSRSCSPEKTSVQLTGRGGGETGEGGGGGRGWGAYVLEGKDYKADL